MREKGLNKSKIFLRESNVPCHPYSPAHPECEAISLRQAQDERILSKCELLSSFDTSFLLLRTNDLKLLVPCHPYSPAHPECEAIALRQAQDLTRRVIPSVLDIDAPCLPWHRVIQSVLDIKKGAISAFFFKHFSQTTYFLPNAPKRLLNLSTRPPVSAAFCLPV